MGLVYGGWCEKAHVLVADFRCLKAVYGRGIGLFCIQYI